LIEGASEGRGLGLQFLRHLERTSVIAYMIDSSNAELPVLDALKILKDELLRFGADLAAKRCVVVLTKSELVDETELEKMQASLEAEGHDVLVISAVTGIGLTELKHKLFTLVREAKEQALLALPPAMEIYDSPSAVH